MSHSLLFHPNLSAACMDFCRSGGKTLKRGNSLLSLVLAHPPAAWGGGLIPPRTKTSVAGVCAWVTHLFPCTGSPAHTLVALSRLSQLDRLAHPRGARRSAALQTPPAAPAAGAGAAQRHNPVCAPHTSPPQPKKQSKLAF